MISTRHLIILISLSTLFLQSCANLKETPKEKLPYFEGTVNYELEYEFFTKDREFKEMVMSFAPSRSTLLYKNGNYIKHHYRNDSLISTTLYLGEPCMIYNIDPNSDTVTYVSMKTTEVNTDIVNYDKGETVLGYNTSSISSLMTGKKEVR